MKFLSTITTLAFTSSLISAQGPFDFDRKGLDASKIPFEPKVGDKPFTNYLQMSLDFQYFQPIFQKLNTTVGVPLKSRGEAHVTIVTPPEFDKVLSKAGVTMQEINEIALRRKIQSSHLAIACVGRDKGIYDNKPQEVYNLVLRNTHDFINIRKDIFKLYKAKGGEGSQFQPEAFWGHITLGYLNRDLFLEDGVFKGENSCWAPIKFHGKCPRKHNL